MVVKAPRSKKTKEQRKNNKRKQLLEKKTLLPEPKNIRYEQNFIDELVLFTGKVDSNCTASYVRFKLSGQQDFLPFGYQAKIAITNASFCFEIPLAALLDEDEIAIQVFNEQGQMSQPFICRFVKQSQPSIEKAYEPRLPEIVMSRVEKYRK